MDRTIRYKLEQLAKRLRSQVFACLLIGLWMIMLATIFQISKQTNIGNSPSLSKVYLLSIFMVGSGLLYLWQGKPPIPISFLAMLNSWCKKLT